MRVAFTNIPRRVWAGGHNYQRNLFDALNRYRPGEVRPVLFAGMNDDAAEIAVLAHIPGVEVFQSRAFDRTCRSLLSAIAFGVDGSAAAEFRARQVDIVFESARFFGWRLPFPTIAWFPDFQHRLLPSLFSRNAYWRRDLGFRIQIASGRHIMLSSGSALGDFRRFYPGAANSVSVVRFATEPPPSMLTTGPPDIVARYGLPQQFLYLPNQFRRHKNHQLVIDALGLLKQRGIAAVVAASGSAHNPGEPDYFENTMRQVKVRGLDSNFRHLGMIPLDHVYALLRMSVALINPSKCEGWSTTVEEAKSFGVPMILSDIDVHREQSAEAARYFAPNDPERLADHITEVLERAGPVIVRDLRAHVEERVRGFVDDFITLARDLVRTS